MHENFFHKLKVYYEDTDSGGVVYYANYLKFLERARTEALYSIGYSNKKNIISRAPQRKDFIMSISAMILLRARDFLTFFESRRNFLQYCIKTLQPGTVSLKN